MGTLFKTLNAAKSAQRAALCGIIMGLALVGCGKSPKTFSPTTTDGFTFNSIDFYAQAGALYQADYLIAFDPSYSFLSNKTVLENSIRSFTARLRSEGIDYRVGFVNGNIQSTCSDKKSCISADFMGGVLTPTMGSSSEDQVISQIANPLSANYSVHLETVDKILRTRSASFLRSGAQLVIVLISDSDDKSDQVTGLSGSLTAAGYAAKFKSAKSSSSYVSARAIVYTGASGCTSGTFGTSTGTRIAAAAAAADHLGTNVTQCITSNFAQSLENLAVNVTVAVERFQLKQAAVPGTLQVFVGGQPQLQASDFNFAPASSEVVFTAGNIPALGTSVEFHYEPILKLSATPQSDSLQVFVNGSQVNRSSSDGFTYVPGENRIMLWGSAAVQGATIRVSYQLNN